MITRFAPSLTGYLHLGHVLHMIYVWGIARAQGGQVICRIDVKADLKARMAQGFTPPEPKYRTGAFAKYAKLVHSASDGAVTSFPFD